MSAYVMVAVLIMRVYWAFKGNKYASWKVFFPFEKEGFAKDVAYHQVLIFFYKTKQL